jgi:ADP-L-glycero-D-manno-heptose 6-epimerase
MLIVTGGEGFIGKALIRKLRERGYNDIISYDVKSLSIKEILNNIQKLAKEGKIDFIFHLGAISNTISAGVKTYDEYNYRFSIVLYAICQFNKIPSIFASSAATYGNGYVGFDDNISPFKLFPLNDYGESKNDTDIWIEENAGDAPCYRLKFFNVYGYDESHKGRMASMVYHSFNQIMMFGYVRLFKSYYEKYEDGEQLRDFIYVEDVCDVCINFMEKLPESNIYNVGTGQARSFNDLAGAVFSALNLEPQIKYIDIPDDLKKQYQYFTEAKINKLMDSGCGVEFHSLEEGVFDYVRKLLKNENR